MADWTNINDSQVDPDAPVTSELGYAWRDNPIAIAEGAPGAPRIVRGALSTSTNSVSGSVPVSGSTVVQLNAYSFFPNIRKTVGSNVKLIVQAVDAGTSGADTAQFELSHDGTSSVSFSVSWRYITA